MVTDASTIAIPPRVAQIFDRANVLTTEERLSLAKLLLDSVLAEESKLSKDSAVHTAENIAVALEKSRVLYQDFRERLCKHDSSLHPLDKVELASLMDALSAKIAKGFSFETWQEAEAFMRRV